MVTLLGLTTAVCWGVADFLAAKASKQIGPITSALYVNVASAIVVGVLYVSILPHTAHHPLGGLVMASAGGAIISGAMVLFYTAMAYGPVSVASPISSAYPLVMTFLALGIFHASLSAQQLAAILMIVVGVMAAAGLFTLKKSERHVGKGPAFAIASVTFYGVGFVLMSQAVSRIGWGLASVLQCAAGSLIFIVLLPLTGRGERPFTSATKGLTNHFIIGCAIIGLTGMMALNFAFSHEHTSGAVAGAISACYPVFTILLALKHFKEDVRLVPLSGAAVTIAGVVILSLQ